MFVQPCETFEWGLYILCRNVTDLLCFEYTDKPPIAVAIIHEKQAVTLDDVCLALNGGSKTVKSVDQVKVYGLVWDGEGGGAVVVVHVVVSILAVRIILQYRVFFV